MRSLAVLIALLFAASPIAAEELLGPAEYLQIMTDSKLRYNMLAEPSKTPVKVMECARRDLSTRVVTKGTTKSLVAWTLERTTRKLIEEGEVFYQAEKMAEAGEKFKAAIATDPDVASPYFLYGDTLLFGANDAEGALEHYRKGIALDPTVPLGYLFASTALVRLGRLDEAREQIIKAALYHPPYEIVWEVGAKNPQRWRMKPVTRFKFQPPAGYLGGNARKGIDIFAGKDFSWIGYASCKAVWANEKKFSKQHGSDLGWSLEEERACVLNQMMAQYNATQAKLEEEQKQSGVAAPEIKEEEIMAALPPLESHLFEVAQAKLLDGYILFEIIGQHCPLAMSMMQDEVMPEAEAYIRKYVILPAE
jgi:tetratricopeptide (TPR) repeat protein